MKAVVFLMLLGVLAAQDLPNGESRLPKLKTQFELLYHELPLNKQFEAKGSILVEFTVNEKGKVVNPFIIDSFDFDLNDTVIDKVISLKFKPALQNGIPIKVRYKLPIVFQ